MSKTERAAAIIADAVLIFCGAMAAVGAAPTAYEVPFDLRELMPPIAGVCILISLWFGKKRRGFIFGIILGVVSVAAVLAKFKSIVNGARIVIGQIIASLTATKTFQLSEEELSLIADPSAEATWFLTAAAAVLALILALVLIKGRKLTPSLLIPIPFFLIALVYTNQRPATWCGVLLMLYIGGVLAGFGLRKAKAPSAGIFLAILLPLLLIMSLAIIKLSPESEYQPIPYEQRRDIIGKRFGNLRDKFLWASSHNPDETDLKTLGDRKETDDRLFFVSSSRAGTYLLRNHSYGRYSDGTWLAADEYKGEWRSQEALGSRRNGRKETLYVYGAKTNERFVPYCFEPDPEVKTNESYVRAMGETSYQWSFTASYTLYTRAVSKAEQEYYTFAKKQYTMPASDEKTALRLLLAKAGISRTIDDYQTALLVADFVRESGEYTLTPGRLPDGEDFVQYFLTKGHKGYCVHFASSTAALLQALDIPARYTVGCYARIGSSGEWVEVPQKLSHAWAEIYVRGIGWIPIESTPGFSFDYTGQNSDSSANPYVPYNPVVTSTDPYATPEQDEPTPSPSPAQRSASPRPSSTPQPSSTPRPSGGGSGNGGGSVKKSSHLRWLIIPGAYLVWFVIGSLLRKRREARFMQDNGRKGVLLMLRYHSRLQSLFGVPALSEAEELANEATFSRHGMKEKQVELYKRICTVRRRLCLESSVRRVIFRWVLFLL